MKILGWNCRGMLSPTAVRELLDLQGRLRADVVFLSESHLNKAKVIELKSKLGFDLLNIVESDGRSCGLVMFYNLINDVVLNFSSQNFIDGPVMNCNSVAWRFTRFYGEPSWELKHQSRTAIRDLNKDTMGPRIIIKVFNEILVSSEKKEVT